MMESGKQLRIGIVGAGFISAFHVRALQSVDGVRLVAMCDADSQKAEALSGAGVAGFTSLERMFAEARPDFVHILTPPAAHAGLAVECMERSAGVFIEKPVAASSADGRTIAGVAARTGRIAGVNHNALYHPAFQRLTEAIAGRRLGGIEHVTATVNVPLRQLNTGDHGHWMFQKPGNIVLEQGPHPLSQIVRLVGKVRKISTLVSGEQTLNTGVPFFNTWQISLECERGTASCFLSFGREHMDNWIQVIGQDGSAFADLRRNRVGFTGKSRYLEPVEYLLHGLRDGSSIAGQSLSQFTGYVRGFLGLGPAADTFSQGILASIQAFYGNVRSHGRPPVGLDEACAVVEACEGIGANVAVEPGRIYA
jgi:predicted dehydrogenase